MRSFLTVTTAATSLALLTPEEMRVAAGLASTDGSQDAVLSPLGLRIAASIMAECKIAFASGGEPTLLKETLSETFYGVRADSLVLGRRHNVTIASVNDRSTTLDPADYVVDPEAGILTRLSNDCPVRWCSTKLVVVYNAGFTDVPGDLKQAALDFFRYAWLEGKRDPALKSEVIDTPDVERTERAWWVGSVPGQSFEGAVPDIVAGQLKRFRNFTIR
ncbi:hypothetical protein BFX40_20360 [Mesorhizobium sp. SEMIA 3007]|uniref:hypothetical protein n=1 Tax=Mesorhizobium sp. SEMIA 3007 TaxID=1862350 RepID=UPI00083D24D3|nr:hypothetical protein [Mesorhizobium sp. SEMIA 3007]ODA94983.1 hypothetical protein BFX40_20360 [Mesorhizobium sp. SEMIA 3007]